VDLIGFTVVDGQGRERGIVEDLEEAGPQDLLRLKGGMLVPLGLVREVQMEARKLIVDAPDGLFEE
jgi:ribosomal 30S subunit maturation factor RimM